MQTGLHDAIAYVSTMTIRARRSTYTGPFAPRSIRRDVFAPYFASDKRDLGTAASMSDNRQSTAPPYDKRPLIAGS